MNMRTAVTDLKQWSNKLTNQHSDTTTVCVSVCVCTCAGREAVGQRQHHVGGGRIQSVGVVGLRGGAEAGGEGGSGQQLLALGGQRGVPGEGAPYRRDGGGRRGRLSS